jgi:hypothetical protein
MIAAPVQCDVDGIPKGSHYASVPLMGRPAKVARFLHQPENLTTEERQKLANLSTGPVGAELRVTHTFLEEWFAIWQDELGNRRTFA